MSTARTADLYLADLGREMGRDGLAFDAAGAVTLVLETGLVLELRVEGDGAAVRLESPLAGSGPALPDSFLRRCLAGNFLWQGTRGATLLVEPGSGFRVRLRQRLDTAATDYAAFRAATETFLNTAAAWQRACRAALDEPAADAPAATAAPTIPEPLMIIRG